MRFPLAMDWKIQTLRRALTGPQLIKTQHNPTPLRHLLHSPCISLTPASLTINAERFRLSTIRRLNTEKKNINLSLL